jgi:hypothetical protein
VNTNLFLTDGSNYTCPCQGVSRAEPIIDIIQELHVQTIGASVEWGNSQGGIFNVITRQGGDRLTAQTSYYSQLAGLTSQPMQLNIKDTTLYTGYERVKYHDVTAGVGGPAWPGRLWFYGAFQYLRDYDAQPGTDPASPRTYEQNKVFGKLNWRLTPTLQLMQSFHQERWVNPPPPTVATPFETTPRLHASVPNMTFASLTHTLSDRMLWEFRLSRFMLRQDGDPQNDDRTTPPHTDVNGIASVNVGQMTTLHLDRITVKGVLHRYEPDLWGLNHQFRVGAAYERGMHRLSQTIPGGVRYHDSNGDEFQAIYKAPAISGGIFHAPALFASDTLRVGQRVTVDAGLRYDYSRAINPDLPVVDAEGRETDVMLPGKGTRYTHNVFSPRLGANIRLDGDGRTVVRASFGVFYQGVLTGELDPISQGATTQTTMFYDPATGGYTRLGQVVDPSRNILPLDPETRSPRTNEFSISLDRDVTSLIRASISYVRKRGHDFIGWIDQGGQYADETRTLVDGTVVPVKVLTNLPEDRRFLLTNPDTQFLHYDGLVIAAEKRLSSRWQAIGSYTYSRAYGMQSTSNGAPDEPQFSTIARAGFLTFGQDPNDLTNATGRLPNDRPHVFRANGSIRLPWYDVLVAMNAQHYTGRPWAAAGIVKNLTRGQGDRRILLEPRGTRRLPSQSIVDLRVAKTLPAGRAGTVELIFDVLNLLNDAAVEALVSDVVATDVEVTPTFGQPRVLMNPRRAMLGVRLNFGR